MTSGKPVLAVTPGEPAGIGPEILLRLALEHPDFRLLAVADIELLNDTAHRFSIPVQCLPWQAGQPLKPGALHCCHVPMARPAEPGVLDPENAPYVLNTLRRAVQLVQEDHAAALVTGPVHKGVINDAGVPFSGHTEFLAELSNTARVVMMLAAPGLRVTLATTHLPLADVPAALDEATLEAVIRITHSELRSRFGIEEPVVQVLGLNPHAGEGGHLGREDDDLIRPVIDRLRDEGLQLTGPVPADTAFTPPRLEACDAVVAMYHDQGLPVLKHMGFGRSVNITLGLPFIRTSVDHGTALDIAVQGGASTDSLYHALAAASEMAANRSHHGMTA